MWRECFPSRLISQAAEMLEAAPGKLPLGFSHFPSHFPYELTGFVPSQ